MLRALAWLLGGVLLALAALVGGVVLAALELRDSVKGVQVAVAVLVLVLAFGWYRDHGKRRTAERETVAAYLAEQEAAQQVARAQTELRATDLRAERAERDVAVATEAAERAAREYGARALELAARVRDAAPPELLAPLDSLMEAHAQEEDALREVIAADSVLIASLRAQVFVRDSVIAAMGAQASAKDLLIARLEEQAHEGLLEKVEKWTGRGAIVAVAFDVLTRGN